MTGADKAAVLDGISPADVPTEADRPRETRRSDDAVWTLRIPRPRRPGVRFVLVVVLIALVLAAGLTTWQRQRGGADAAARAAAVAVASRQVLTLTTVSPATGDAQLQRLLTNSTGTLKSEIARYADSFTASLKESGASSTGSVVESGVVSIGGDRAVVLVALDVVVRTPKAADRGQGYRWQLTLDRRDGRWLVSGLNDVTAAAVSP